MSRLDVTLDPKASSARRVEVITGGGGGRRRWSDDEKARAIAPFCRCLEGRGTRTNWRGRPTAFQAEQAASVSHRALFACPCSWADKRFHQAQKDALVEQHKFDRLAGRQSLRARRVTGEIEQRRKDNQGCEPKCNVPALRPVAYAHPTCHSKND